MHKIHKPIHRRTGKEQICEDKSAAKTKSVFRALVITQDIVLNSPLHPHSHGRVGRKDSISNKEILGVFRDGKPTHAPLIGSPDELDLRHVPADALDGSDWVHNHPSSGIVSPKDARTAAFGQANSVKAIRYHGGHTTLVPSDYGWPDPDELFKTYNRALSELERLGKLEPKHQNIGYQVNLINQYLRSRFGAKAPRLEYHP